MGFEYYSHFTSPIRRYPDLLVHRLLDEYAHGITPKRQEFFANALPLICKHCSDRERVATDAERASIKVMQVEYMRDHIGDEFDAVISGVMAYGLFVEISDILVEGMVHVRNIDDDYYLFDEKHYSLIGERNKKIFRLGDSIRVKVFKVNTERRQIDFMYVPTEEVVLKKSGKKRKKK